MLIGNSHQSLSVSSAISQQVFEMRWPLTHWHQHKNHRLSCWVTDTATRLLRCVWEYQTKEKGGDWWKHTDKGFSYRTRRLLMLSIKRPVCSSHTSSQAPLRWQLKTVLAILRRCIYVTLGNRELLSLQVNSDSDFQVMIPVITFSDSFIFNLCC